MKFIIKTVSCLFIVALVASCASGNIVVTDSPELPSVPQPTVQQPATQTPTPPQEEKMETRSSGATSLSPGTAQRGISSTKVETIKGSTH